MEKSKKLFYAFLGITGIFFFLLIFYIPGNEIVLSFNSGDEPYVFSKLIILVFLGLINYFIGFQLYDDKNKGDYARWYFFAGLLIALEIWILLSNLA
jgi:hypothetical protein